MSVTAEIQGFSAVVTYKGDLTAEGLDALKQAVEQRLTDPKVHDVVLNMEGVPFIDSACMEYLLELRDRLTERMGQVKLACLDANVAKILEITRLEETFARFDSVAEAAQAL